MRTFRFFGYLAWYLSKQCRNINRAEKLYKSGQVVESRRLLDDIIEKGMHNLLKIAGANIDVKGAEYLSEDETYLFVSNHQGNFDVPILFTTSPVKMAFVAKKEMEKIPLLSKAMAYRDCIFLDRENPREAIKGINKGLDLLKEGESLALFPEGTRSKGQQMNSFQSGGLRLAMKSSVKVVPVTLNYSYKLMEGNNGKITPANVEVVYSKPIDTSDFKKVGELSEALQKQIQSQLR